MEDIRESLDIIISKPKPLAAYLFTTDKKLQDEFVSSVPAGGMCINDTALHVGQSLSLSLPSLIASLIFSINLSQITNPNLPFGGVGESGTGAYHGKFSFDTFSHKKGVLRRSFAGEVPARYPPYTPWKSRMLKALVNGNLVEIILLLFGWTRPWSSSCTLYLSTSDLSAYIVAGRGCQLSLSDGCK